jgi:hypothetical protein
VRLGNLGYSSQVQRESALGRFRGPQAALTGASDVRHLQRKVRWLSAAAPTQDRSEIGSPLAGPAIRKNVRV